MKEKIKKEKYDIDMWGNIVKRPPSKSEIVRAMSVRVHDNDVVKDLIRKLMGTRAYIRMHESINRLTTDGLRRVMETASLTEIKISEKSKEITDKVNLLGQLQAKKKVPQAEIAAVEEEIRKERAELRGIMKNQEARTRLISEKKDKLKKNKAFILTLVDKLLQIEEEIYKERRKIKAALGGS